MEAGHWGGGDVKEIIRHEIEQRKPEYVLTASDPCGVCEMAKVIARETAVPLKVFFLNQKEHGRGKYHWRSVAVLKDCDFCLFIHDGQSKGTRNEIVLARKLGTPHEVHILKPTITKDDLSAAIAALTKGN